MEKLIITTPEELKQFITEAVHAALKEAGLPAASEARQNAGSKYMTIAEAAEYLNLAKQTVYGFTSRREIPFIKRAKRLLFTKADLNEWLAQGKKKSIIQLRSGTSGSLGSYAGKVTCCNRVRHAASPGSPSLS